MIVLADLKRVVTSWQFYISILGGLILFSHPIFLSYSYWEYSSPLELFSIAMGISDFTPFAVIFAVLPFGTSFCEDYRSRYSNSIVSRIGFRKYIWGRWIAVALSGALAMGLLMLGIVILCLASAGVSETIQSSAFLNNGVWASIALINGGFWFYLLRIMLAMIFGSLWATVGLLISTIIPNSYLVLILPFVIYQGLWYLLEHSLFNPLYYFRADFIGIPSLTFAFCFQIFWNLVVAVCALFLMRRRLQV